MTKSYMEISFFDNTLHTVVQPVSKTLEEKMKTFTGIVGTFPGSFLLVFVLKEQIVNGQHQQSTGTLKV